MTEASPRASLTGNESSTCSCPSTDPQALPSTCSSGRQQWLEHANRTDVLRTSPANCQCFTSLICVNREECGDNVRVLQWNSPGQVHRNQQAAIDLLSCLILHAWFDRDIVWCAAAYWTLLLTHMRELSGCTTRKASDCQVGWHSYSSFRRFVKVISLINWDVLWLKWYLPIYILSGSVELQIAFHRLEACVSHQGDTNKARNHLLVLLYPIIIFMGYFEKTHSMQHRK